MSPEALSAHRDKALVLRAMEDLVDAGYGAWSLSPRGLRTFTIATGEVYELEASCVRRIK